MLIDEPVAGTLVMSVSVDNRGGGRMVAEHFAALGRRRAAVLGAPEGMPTSSARIESFVQRATELGLGVPAIGTAERRTGDAVDQAVRMLDAHPGIDCLFAGDDRDSTALTRAADDAADRGDWTTAVVERFRAIIRSLDERGALEDYPGMTAHEAATVAASVVVGHADDLHRAGVLFDAVRYGEIDPTFEQDVWMRDLADAIHRTQPAVEPALAEVPVHGRGGPL